jgi:hypothetical protein
LICFCEFDTQALGISERMVPLLKATTAGAFMFKQAKLLARLAVFAIKEPPLVTITRLKFDETGEKLSANLDGQGNVLSAWQVVVARMSVLVCWGNGASIKLNIVQP